MCQALGTILKEKYPTFTSREWFIYIGVILAILGGNVINLVFNILKYQAAAANPVTSISQVLLTGNFPAFTLGMCLIVIDPDAVAYVGEGNVTAIRTLDNSNITVKYAPIDNEDTYADCWLIPVPSVPLAVKKTKGRPPSEDQSHNDGVTITTEVTEYEPNATQSQAYKSRMLGVFAGLPANTEAFPDDFDPRDFENQFQILFPGYSGSIPVSCKEDIPFHGTSTVSFPLNTFRTQDDTNIGDSFSLDVSARALNQLKTVSKQDTTFGLSQLFAALLSIVNISLTVFAVVFPTAPLVVSQTYFRGKPPALFDPTKTNGQELSRPGSVSPSKGEAEKEKEKEEIALVST